MVQSLKVLVVDDSSVIRRLMRMALDQMQLEADFVENGIEALTCLQTNKYDIIFLDIMMEGMDGYKVCKYIKSQPATKDIPVIMLTSKDGTIDKIRGKLSGANHYLTKPLKMQELRQTIEKYIPFVAPPVQAPHNQSSYSKRPPRPKPAARTQNVSHLKPKRSTQNTIQNTTENDRNQRALTREERIARVRRMMQKD